MEIPSGVYWFQRNEYYKHWITSYAMLSSWSGWWSGLRWCGVAQGGGGVVAQNGGYRIPIENPGKSGKNQKKIRILGLGALEGRFYCKFCQKESSV